MARDQVPTAPTNDDGVPMMLRLNFQHRALGELVQVNTTFDLRLHDVPVHLITEVGIRHKRPGNGDRRRVIHSRCLYLPSACCLSPDSERRIPDTWHPEPNACCYGGK